MQRNLVFIKNDKAVTDSLTVSEVFGKEHRRVMQDIRDLGCSELFRQHNFVQSTYVNQQNREMPLYFMSQKGFTLLVMGYTGKDAMQFKEAYIDEFERMENQLKQPRVLSEKEQLVASMRLTIETSEEVNVLKGEVKEIRDMVQEQITLDHGEQRRVQKGIGQKVYETTNDTSKRKKLFAELHRDIKDRFGVSSYKDIKRKDMQLALRYIDAWVPKKVVS